MLMDLVCSSCGELMEDAVKKNMRIRVLASDVTKVRTCCRIHDHVFICDLFVPLVHPPNENQSNLLVLKFFRWGSRWNDAMSR